MPTNITFSKFEPVDEGTYHVKVTGFNERVATKGPSRDPFLAWDLEILNNPKYPSKKISFAMGYSIGPNAMGTKFLKALGWILPTVPGDLQLDPNNFIGRECFAKFSREKDKKDVEVNKMKEVWSVAEMQGISAQVRGIVNIPPVASAQRFDPETGLPIIHLPTPAPKFDPNTGLPINAAPAVKFDPNTGLPINAAPALKFDPNTGQPLVAPIGGGRTYEPVQPITRTPNNPTGIPPMITPSNTGPVIANSVIPDSDDMNFPK